MMAEGLDGGRILALCMSLLQVGFMFYFAIAALTSAGISPFYRMEKEVSIKYVD
jgi:hypothetical protein